MKLLTPETKETIVELIWGTRIQRYRTPVGVGPLKLIERSIRSRCIQCGRDKINWQGTDACPVHDLTPGFREQDYPVNPKH